MIYVIEAHEVNKVKIGRTQNLEKRLDALYCSSPVSLQLKALLPGDAAKEYELHNRFKAYHSHGEWFLISGELEIWLNSLPLLTSTVAEKILLQDSVLYSKNNFKIKQKLASLHRIILKQDKKSTFTITTTSTPIYNRSRKSGIRSSKYVNVYWVKAIQKWRALGITPRSGKQFHLGLFTDELDAAKAVNQWRHRRNYPIPNLNLGI